MNRLITTPLLDSLNPHSIQPKCSGQMELVSEKATGAAARLVALADNNQLTTVAIEEELVLLADIPGESMRIRSMTRILTVLTINRPEEYRALFPV